MKEEFIHFLWKYRLFDVSNLKTTKGLPVRVINPGVHNLDSGPDFFASQIEIDGTLWAGNVEIHINSSDWVKHGHQKDPAYNNIILHVVMNHDAEILDNKENPLPEIEMRNHFDYGIFHRYERILSSKTWVPCEKYMGEVSPVILMNWLNRLLVERLENKAVEIKKFYSYFENSWEQTFYFFLARNFGFKVNAMPFALLAQQTPYNIFGKIKNDLTMIEALLFGQAGMLNEDFKEAYPSLLKKEYQFLQHKFNLNPIDKSLWKFGKMRPSNFPTIRITQFARLIFQSTGLFSKLIESKSLIEIQGVLSASCSPYWVDHYLFDKATAKKTKSLGLDAISGIIINTVVPLKFVYGSETFKPEIRDEAMALLSELPPEHNSIVSNFSKIGITPSNAGDSQALIELKKYYCTPKKCLHCSIGHFLIKTS
jgi:hypothetical protein